MQVNNTTLLLGGANPSCAAKNISQNDKPKNSHLFDFSQIEGLLFEDEPSLQLLSFNLELQVQKSDGEEERTNQFENADFCLFPLENVFFRDLKEANHNAEAEQFSNFNLSKPNISDSNLSNSNSNTNLPAEAKVDLGIFNFSLFSENKSVKIPQNVQNLADNNPPLQNQKEKQSPLKSIENAQSVNSSKLNIIVQSEDEIPEMEFKIAKNKETQSILFQNENILSNKQIQSENTKHNNSQLQLLLSLKSNSYFPKESESRTQNISQKIENIIPSDLKTSDLKTNNEASSEEETTLTQEKKNFTPEQKNIKAIPFAALENEEAKAIRIEGKKEAQILKQNDKIELNKNDNIEKETKPDFSAPKKESKEHSLKGEQKQNDFLAEKRITSNVSLSSAAETEVEGNDNNAQNKAQLNKNSQENQTANLGNALHKTQNLAKDLNALNTSKTFDQGISQYTTRIYPNEFARTTFNVISALPDNSSGTANLILKPASLGTIIVNINLKDKMLNVDIKPENKDVAKIIESQLPQLKERLASVGVQFDSINLNEDQAEKDLTEKKQSKKEDKEKQKELKALQDFVSSLTKEEKEIETII
ncbi:MAG: flagellar hook-length control protein FliK [Ignavibacteria bacterium]|nr:flagellar hook-length control protein FliK [Ignavibacteria bacterium]